MVATKARLNYRQRSKRGRSFWDFVVDGNKRRPIPLQWMNYFTNRLYVNRNDPVSWRFLTVWGTGSSTWILWPFVSRKRQFLRIRQGWGVSELTPIKTKTAGYFMATWYLLKRKQAYYVPARYIYLISAVWLPYYLLCFYTCKPVISKSSQQYSSSSCVAKRFYPTSLYAEALIRRVTYGIVRNRRLRQQRFSKYKQIQRLRPMFYDRRIKMRLSYLWEDKVKNYFVGRSAEFLRLNNLEFKKWLLCFKVCQTLHRFRQAHRFAAKHNITKIFYHQWSRFALRFAMGRKILRKRNRIAIPHKYRHTQRNPWRYYNQSRWDAKAHRWLTPLLYNRKLFPYHLLSCVTLEKRHPSRYKKYRHYKWFKYALTNRWNYGMEATKSYRLKQILFGRIFLPALGSLSHKGFHRIKKNVARIKPLSGNNSRQAGFLGRFERRLDVLIYKLNFAPTLHWARLFVSSGFIYVSQWMRANQRVCSNNLGQRQNFPLWIEWKMCLSAFFTPVVQQKQSNQTYNAEVAAKRFALPIRLPSYRVSVGELLHWTNPNIIAWFDKKQVKRRLPSYVITNKSQNVVYFWRNIKLGDIAQLCRERIQKNTLNWLS